MVKGSAFSEQDRAELVAFLDGELPEAEARRVEARMARDPMLRREAERLAKTWDMLEWLPRVEAPADFASRTASRIRTGRLARGWSWSRLATLAIMAAAWVAGCAAAAAAGFALVQVLHPSAEQWLAEDPQLLQRLDIYRAVPDFSFAEYLQRSGLFAPPSPLGGHSQANDDGGSGSDRSEDAQSQAAASRADTRAAEPPASVPASQAAQMAPDRENGGGSSQSSMATLQALDAEERSRLWRLSRQFDSLPEQKRRRIQDLHAAIQDLPPSQRRRHIRAMTRYANWLQQLPAYLHERVEQAGRDELEAVVAEVYRQQQAAQRQRDYWFVPPPLEPAVARVLGRLSPQEIEALDNMLPPERMDSLVTYARKLGLARLPRLGPRPPADSPSAQTRLTIRRLQLFLKSLPAERRQQLRRLPRDRFARQLIEWFNQAHPERPVRVPAKGRLLRLLRDQQRQEP